MKTHNKAADSFPLRGLWVMPTYEIKGNGIAKTKKEHMKIVSPPEENIDQDEDIFYEV